MNIEREQLRKDIREKLNAHKVGDGTSLTDYLAWSYVDITNGTFDEKGQEQINNLVDAVMETIDPKFFPFGCNCTSMGKHVLGDGCAICQPNERR